MLRARSLIAVARVVLAIAGTSLLVLGLLAFSAVPALAASTPAATPTSTPSPGASAAKKPPTVTFGIGPSNGTTLDGRPDFGYAASPGSVINDHFALVNISAQPLDLYVYGADAVDAAGGALSYQPRDAKILGASGWLALPDVNGSPLIHVQARSTAILPFQLRVPANASPGDHTAGIAVGLTAFVKGASTKNLTFEQRVVAKVRVRVSGTAVAKLAIQHLQASYSGVVNPFGAGTVTLTYTVSNIGNIDVGANQKVTVSGLFGSSQSAVEAPIPDLLPGSSTTVTTRIHNVWPAFLVKGTVKVTPVALPNAVYPALTTVSATTSFWAMPWPQIVLIVIIVLAVLGLWWYRRHRKARPPVRTHRRGGAQDTMPPIPEAEPSL